jgi:hypothetical protein
VRRHSRCRSAYSGRWATPHCADMVDVSAMCEPVTAPPDCACSLRSAWRVAG